MHLTCFLSKQFVTSICDYIVCFGEAIKTFFNSFRIPLPRTVKGKTLVSEKDVLMLFVKVHLIQNVELQQHTVPHTTHFAKVINVHHENLEMLNSSCKAILSVKAKPQ